MKKNTNILFLSAMVFIAGSTALAKPWDVELTFLAEKYEYFVGEGIHVQIAYNNMGVDSDSYWMNPNYLYHFINSKGDSFITDILIGGEIGNYYDIPGKSAGKYYSNLAWFRSRQGKQYFLPPDNYEIKGYMGVKGNEGKTQYIYSKTYKFNVIEPKGEEAEAYKLFYNAEFAGKNALNSYWELYHKYPNTVYGMQAYSEWLRLRGWKKYGLDGVKEIEKFIKQYPGYPNIKYRVADVVRAYKEKGGNKGAKKKIEELMKLTKKAKNNALKNALEEELKRIK